MPQWHKGVLLAEGIFCFHGVWVQLQEAHDSVGVWVQLLSTPHGNAVFWMNGYMLSTFQHDLILLLL